MVDILWLEIDMKKCIALFTIVFMVFALCACGRHNSPNTESTTSNTEDIHESTERKNEDSEAEKCMVRFYEIDGTLSYSEEVKKGCAVNSIPHGSDRLNAFFAGWGAPTGVITENKSLTALYDEVEGVKNAIGYNCVYSKMDEECVVDISVTGEVNFSSLEIKINLGTELQYINEVYCDNSAFVHYSPEEKTVYIAMAFRKNITETIDICSLKVKTSSTSSQSVPFSIEVEDIAYINDEDEIVSADYSVFNENIVVY